MVQNTNTTSKQIGRRPGFDREAVVAAAIIAFWERGFEATTLSDLEAATGVDRSSIYNSFGGKDGLYRTAAAAYVDSADDVLFDPLHNGTAGLDDIVEFLDRLSANLGAAGNPRGCLIVNDMTAAVDRQATDRYLERLEDGLLAALERAAASEEIGTGTTSRRAHVLAAAILGINIAHRHNGSGEQARILLDALRAEARSWMVPQ